MCLGARIYLLFVIGLALAVAPAVAVATRPSVSPVYQANYKGFESGSPSKLAVKFGMTIAENEIVPRGHWFAYGMHDIRLHTDCSQTRSRSRERSTPRFTGGTWRSGSTSVTEDKA